MSVASGMGLLDEELRRFGKFSLRIGSRVLGYFGIDSDGKEILSFGPPVPPVGPPAGISSLTLWFPAPRDATAVLTGTPGGKAIPIPGSFAAGRALSFFRIAGKKVSAALAGTDQDTAPVAGPAMQRAILLLNAVVRGIVEVANHDPAVADRRAHMGFGTIELRIEDDPPYSLTIDATEEKLQAVDTETDYAMRGEIPASPGSPSVCLSFSSPAAAIEVLSGAADAVVALGTGAVRIRGRLPLVQNLFPILDRLGEYMRGGPVKGKSERGKGELP